MDDETKKQAITIHRFAITGISDGLADLLTTRIEVCAEIGRLKAELGLPVVNGVRDQEVLDGFYTAMQAKGYTGTREFPDAVMTLIINDSKARQEKIIAEYRATH